MNSEFAAGASPPHWVAAAIGTPSVMVIDSLESQSLYGEACQALDPHCKASLQVLFNRKQGSRQIINYLTPTQRLSHHVHFHFTSSTAMQSSNSMASLDVELQNAVAEQLPATFGQVQPMMRGANNREYPWFTSFKHCLLRATHFQQDFYQHTQSTLHLPSCIVFAISALEDDVLQRAKSLTHEHAALLQHNLPRVYCLVSNEDMDNDSSSAAKLRRMEQELGPGTCVGISLANERALEAGFHLLCDRIVTLLSNRAFALNETVSQNKRGLSSTLRMFFSSSPAPQTAGSGSNSGTGSSSNAKTRALADLLFVLRDYEGALHTYALLRDEFNKDALDLLKLGNVYEMSALCHLLLLSQQSRAAAAAGGSSSSSHGSAALESMERAMDCYLKGAAALSSMAQTATAATPTAVPSGVKKQVTPAHRLATNATILLLEIVPGRNMNHLKLVRRILLIETELCSAMLLEQAALIMQQQQPQQVVSMRKKACFDLLRAASLFRTLGLNAHAFRCYMQVYREDIKRNSKWFAAEHHLQLNLGYLAKTLGDSKQVVELRGALLERGYQVINHPGAQHAVLLQEYLSEAAAMAQRGGEEGMVLRHKIPRLDFDTKALQQPLQVYALERSTLRVSVTNPLFCALTVSKMRVYFGSSSSGEEEANVRCDALADFTLQGKEARQVELLFTPQDEQVDKALAIRGVEWELLGCPVRFQHILLPPIPLKLFPKQACLQARVLSQTSEGGAQFQLQLRNVGPVALEDCKLVFTCSDAGSLQLGTNTRGVQVLDANTICLPNALPQQRLQVGECLTLHCKLYNAVRDCIVSYADGRRSLPIELPNLARFDPPKLKARVVVLTAAANSRLLVVDVTSQYPIRPLGMACYSNHAWRISSIGGNGGGTAQQPVRFPGRQCARTWQLVFNLSKASSTTSSTVQLSEDAGYKTDLLVPEEDFRLRVYHLRAVKSEAARAKRRLEALRAEMEAKGQFPITIQDVRRARQANPVVFAAMDAPVTTFAPGSAEALTLDKSNDFLHLALDWTGAEPSSAISKTYCCRVPVPLPGLRLSLMADGGGEPLAQLSLVPGQERCDLPLTLRVENLGANSVYNLQWQIGSEDFQHPNSFPRPQLWLGETTSALHREFKAGEVRDVCVSAVFVSAGVYLLGPISAQYDLSEEEKPAFAGSGDMEEGGKRREVVHLEGERFVVVKRSASLAAPAPVAKVPPPPLLVAKAAPPPLESVALLQDETLESQPPPLQDMLTPQPLAEVAALQTSPAVEERVSSNTAAGGGGDTDDIFRLVQQELLNDDSF